MASVIREGGSNPISVNTWQDALKAALLERMYDEGQRGASKDDFWHRLHQYFYQDLDSFAKKYGHKITEQDVKESLKEMLDNGWIEVAEFPCQCCSLVNRNLEELLKHATRLKLTRKGYDRVTEHIFP